MVVVRDEAGRWQRRERNNLLDGPQLHSDRFYQLYLAQNFLPPWFFRAGHLAMMSDTVEARLLDVDLPATLQEVEPAVPTEGQKVQSRRMLRDVHVLAGGIVNPMQIPAGVGHWEWLDETDRDVAAASGFGSSFGDITNARGAGALSLNPDRNDVPSVVWYPDSRFFNPESEPTGPGHWTFLTSGAEDSDAAMAALQLGGTSGMPNYPTASQISRLRQQYRAQRREDLTAEIRLVWIPGTGPSDSEGDDPVLQPLTPDDGEGLFVTGNTPEVSEAEQARPAIQPGVLGPGIQPSDFDPTNGNPGGKTDQTARLSTPRYFTYRIAGRIVTVDRARPIVGLVEEHKTYVYTEADWHQHPRHAELDWSDKEAVATLARWRDQRNRRNGWPELRSSRRTLYAEDERVWLEARVREYLDAGKPYDVVATNLGFQERFGDRGERTEAGIASIMLRIRRQYRQRDSGQVAGGSKSDGGSEDEKDRVGEDEEDSGEDGGVCVESGGERSGSEGESDWDPIVVA